MSNSNRSSFRSIVIIAIAVAVGLFAFGALGSLFDIHLPFGTETKDHSPPVIINEIRDLAEFRAAEADLEVIVDQERDVKWVPSFIAGERAASPELDGRSVFGWERDLAGSKKLTGS